MDFLKPLSVLSPHREQAEALIGARMRHVPLRPPEWGVFNNCYWNVRQYIQENGGAAVNGWRITEYPNVCIKFVHHSIARTDAGKERDVTRYNIKNPVKNIDFDTIAFIEDESLKPTFDYAPYFSNKYIVLNPSPLLSEYMTCDERRVSLLRTLMSEARARNIPVVEGRIEFDDPDLVALSEEVQVLASQDSVLLERLARA